MKTRVQALEAVAAAARRSNAWLAPELNDALDELREVEAAEAIRYEEALKVNGKNCKECGKWFLLIDRSPFCSIECRLAEPGENR